MCTIMMMYMYWTLLGGLKSLPTRARSRTSELALDLSVPHAPSVAMSREPTVDRRQGEKRSVPRSPVNRPGHSYYLQ